MEEAKEKKRADEWAAREARIQDAMGRMAETVLKKSNAQEKELERRVMQYAEERDRKAAQDEINKKNAARKRELEVRETLSKQLQEKRAQKEKEMENNRHFIKMVLDQDENYNKAQKEKKI